MAPTVCIPEVCERFSLEDRLREPKPSLYHGERRKHQLRKRPPGYFQFLCKKLRMGLGLVESVSDSASLTQYQDQTTIDRRDIAIRTVALIRRNRRLQYELDKLQAEVKAMVSASRNKPSSPIPWYECDTPPFSSPVHDCDTPPSMTSSLSPSISPTPPSVCSSPSSPASPEPMYDIDTPPSTSSD